MRYFSRFYEFQRNFLKIRKFRVPKKNFATKIAIDRDGSAKFFLKICSEIDKKNSKITILGPRIAKAHSIQEI